jgi:pyridoxal 5'-phosphate synthase pdxS subunit
MIRTKGEAGTGNVIEAVRHMRQITSELAALPGLSATQREAKAEEYRVPLALLEQVTTAKRLPVPNFAAGGVATPADAALIRQLGAESVFVGSGVFTSGNPKAFARAIVIATAFYNDPARLLEVSRGLGDAMRGIEIATIPAGSEMANRGW